MVAVEDHPDMEDLEGPPLDMEELEGCRLDMQDMEGLHLYLEDIDGPHGHLAYLTGRHQDMEVMEVIPLDSEDIRMYTEYLDQYLEDFLLGLEVLEGPYLDMAG